MSDALRILVVDDDHNMARTLADILRIQGHEAGIANSGAEALAQMAKAPFDCVLSDIRMPGIDGIGLFRAIKARCPDLPVVLMTAYSSDKLVKEGLAAGAFAALIKPLEIGHLLDLLSGIRLSVRCA